MDDPQQKVTLADFESCLKELRESQTPYCLVGGLAVGMWAEELLTPKEKAAFELPIKSKDIDLRADRSVATIMRLQLKNEGAIVTYGVYGVSRTPKNPDRAFPSFAMPVNLPAKPNQKASTKTSVEVLSGMPLLDAYQDEQKTTIQQNGTTLLAQGIYLLDPCSLMICKLNAIKTRPLGESDNDLKHATILSLVIPRFIQRSLERNQKNQDPYHPGIDAQRLAGFLSKEPWKNLIPEHEREAMLKACQLIGGDERTDGKSGGKNQPKTDPGGEIVGLP